MSDKTVDERTPVNAPPRRYAGVVFRDVLSSLWNDFLGIKNAIGRKLDPILNYRHFQASVLILIMAFWFGMFYNLATFLHDNFGTVDFDLGIFDQAAWLTANFKRPFMTVRGLDIWGHHANYIFYVLSPGYWIGGGVHYLVGMHIFSQVMASFGIFLLARHLMPKERWIPLLMGVVVLLNPSWQWLIHEFFHPESFAIGFLVFTYWAARSKHWKLFWLFFVLTIICKEDLAIPLIAIGLLLVLWKERKLGLIAAGLALGWYLFISKVVIPARIGEAGFYNSYFGDLGDSPVRVFWNVIINPIETFRLVTTKARLEYMWQMLAPFGFICFLAPEVLLVGLPMLAINVFGVYPWIHSYQTHYAAIPLAAFSIATVEGLAHVKNIPVRKALAILVLVSACWTSYQWGAAPYTKKGREHIWEYGNNDRLATKKEAMSRIPKSAPTSAAYFFVPHLTHRQLIYTYPNPWRESNWGTENSKPDDDRKVKWIIVDRNLMDLEEDGKVFDCLMKKEFKIVYQRDEITVAKRVFTPKRHSNCRILDE